MKKTPVTLAAFRDYIDTLVAEGGNEATIAETAFNEGLYPSEVVEAIFYATSKGIQLNFIPDMNEQDYHPDDEARRQVDLEDQLNRTTDLFSKPIK